MQNSFVRSVGADDDSFATYRSSLRARRERLARREEMLNTQESKAIGETAAQPDESGVVTRADLVATAAASTSTCVSPAVQNGAERASRDRSPAAAMTTAAAAAATTALNGFEHGKSSRSRQPQSDAADDDDEPGIGFTARRGLGGESTAMSNLRRSLPARMRSREGRQWPPPVAAPQLGLLDVESKPNTQMSGSGRPATTAERSSTTAAEASAAAAGNGVRARAINGTAPAEADRRGSHLSAASLGTSATVLEVPEAPRFSVAGAATPAQEETREERIARYKEERRRALAARAAEQLSSTSAAVIPPASQLERDPPQFRTLNVQAESHWPLGKTASDGDERYLQQPRVALSASRVGAADKSDIGDVLAAPTAAAAARPRLPDRDQVASIKSRAVNEPTSTLGVTSDVAMAGNWQPMPEPRARSPSREAVHRLPEAAVRMRQDPPIRDTAAAAAAAAVATSSKSASLDAALVATAASERAAPALPSASAGHTADRIRVPDAEPLPFAGGRSLAAKVTPSIVGSSNTTTRVSDGLDVSSLRVQMVEQVPGSRVDMVEQVPGSRVDMVEQVPGSRGCEAGASAHVLASSDGSGSSERSASEGLRSADQTPPAGELLAKHISSKMPQHGPRSQPAVLKGTSDTLSTHVLGEGRKKASTAREGHAPAFIDILRKFEPSETLLAALSVPTTITPSKSNASKVNGIGQTSARTNLADVCNDQGSVIAGQPAAAAATLTDQTVSTMNASVLPPAEMECISADVAPKATRTKLLHASAAADSSISAVSTLSGVSSSGKTEEQHQPLGAREQPDHPVVAAAASTCTGGQKLSDSERSSSLLTDDDRQSERSSISSTLYVQSSATSSSNTAAASGAAPSLLPVAAVAAVAANSSMNANMSTVCTKQDELTDVRPRDEVTNTVPTTNRTAAFSRDAADSSTEQLEQQLGQASSESKTPLEKQPQQQKQRLSAVPSSPSAQAAPAAWVQSRGSSTVLSRQASASKADSLLDPQLAYLLEARLKRVSDAEPQASLPATTGAADGPVSGMPESQSEEMAAADVAIESAPKLLAAERTATAAATSAASSECPGEMDRSLSSVADKVSFFLREQLRHSDRGSNQFRSGTSLDAQGHIPSEAEEHTIRYSSSTEAAAAPPTGGATVPSEAAARRNVVAAMLPRWHRDRKISKRERSQTQPVTCDEVLAAQCLGCSGEAVSGGHGLVAAAAPLSCSNHGGGEGTGATDDVGIAGSGVGLDALTISSLAVMTLDEKIRLFIERSVVSTVGSLAAAAGVDDQQLATKSDVPISSAAAAALLRSRGPGRPKQSHRTRQQRCLTLPLTSSDMREALGLRAVPLCMPAVGLTPSPTGEPTADVPHVTVATSPTAIGADITQAAADGSLACNQADRVAAAHSAASGDTSTAISLALAVGGDPTAVGSVNQPSSSVMATETVTSTAAALSTEPRHRKISKTGGASAGAHAAPGAAAGAYHTAAATVGKPSRLDKRSSAAVGVEAATTGGGGLRRRDVAGSHRRSPPAAAADAAVASPVGPNPCRADEKQQQLAATDTIRPVSRATPSRRSQKAAATADAATTHAAAPRTDGDKAETATAIKAASTVDAVEQHVDDGNNSKVIAAAAAGLTAMPLSSDERHSATGKCGRGANLVVDRQHSSGSSAADNPVAVLATGAASAAAPLDVPSYMQPTHSHVAYRGATSKVRSVTGGSAAAGPSAAAIPAPVGRHSSAASGAAADGSSATAAAIPPRVAKPSVGGAAKASNVVRDDGGSELPSYMRATSSFAHKVEHLFAEPSSDEDDGCCGGGEPDNGAGDRVANVAPKQERHTTAVAGVAVSEPARSSARRQSSIASQQATVHVHPRDHRQLHSKQHQQQHQEQHPHHLEQYQQQQQPRLDDEHVPSQLHYRRTSVKAEPTKSKGLGDHLAAVDGHAVKVIRSKSMVADGNASGHVPSYMRATTSYASRVEQQHQSQEGHVGEAIGQAQDSTSHGSTPSAAAKGKRPARPTSSAHSPASLAAAAELRAASPALSSASRDAGNTAIGTVPSFMKPTASHAHHMAARGTHDQAKEPLTLATVATTPSSAAVPTAARKQSVRSEAGSTQQHQQRTAGRSNAQHQHSSEVGRRRSSATAASTAAITADAASTNDADHSVVDKCGHTNGRHLDGDVSELKSQANVAQPSVATAAADLSAEAGGDESATKEHEHCEQPCQVFELVNNDFTTTIVETLVRCDSTTSQGATEVEGRSFAESGATRADATSSTVIGESNSEVVGEHVVPAVAAAVAVGVAELVAPPISNACGELGALSIDTGRGASGDGSGLGSASGTGSDVGTDCFSSYTSPHQKQQQQLPSPSRPLIRTAVAVGSRMHKPRSESGIDGQAASTTLPSFMRSTCSSSRKDRHNQPEVEFGEQQLHPTAIAGSETGGCEEEATNHHQPPMTPVSSKQPAARRQKSVVKVHRSDGSDESLASSASAKHESGGRAVEQQQLQQQQLQLQQLQHQQLQQQQPSYMRHTSCSASGITVGKSASVAACGGSSSIMAGDPKHTAHAGVIESKDAAIKKDRTDNASGPAPFAGSASHAVAAGTAESPDECGELTLADRSSSRDGQPQKLALLQKNANEEWKKRLNEATDRDEEKGCGNSPAEAASAVGVTSIAERLSRIQEHSQRWQQKKGQENDATQFTAEAKLAAAVSSSGAHVASSPLVGSRQRVVKRASSLKLKPTAAAGDVAESSSTAGNGRPKSLYFGHTMARKSSPDQGTAKEVEVPSMDDLSAFFTPAATCDDADLPNDADLSHLASTPHLLPIVHRIKAKRNNQAVARNPVKALSNRQDLRTAYTEVISGQAPALVAPTSSKLPATPGHNRQLAREALAGLASKENFKKVALRKTDIHDAGSLLGGKDMLPYKDIMLLQVKGRRHVQVRLVEPHTASINSGDCFLLVLKDSIYAWYGEFANVVEKNKTAELAAFIHATKDLGCKTAQHVVEIDEKKASNLTSVKQFWNHLGGRKDHAKAGPPEEDELYEQYMAQTNAVYVVRNEELLPLEQYTGQQPRFEMLNEREMLVLDFGTELYAWFGREVPLEQRTVAVQLARQLFDQGYDYSECNINPMSPLLAHDKGGQPVKGKHRPKWCLLAKVNQNMETALFREKFQDWPPEAARAATIAANTDKGRDSPTVLVGGSGGSSTSSCSNIAAAAAAGTTAAAVDDPRPADVAAMLTLNTVPVTLQLENSNVGRGHYWCEYEDGLKREYRIETTSVRVWHVLDYVHREVTAPSSYGQFFSGDTYIVRWQYVVRQLGVRSLNGNVSKHQTAPGGRERQAYFFWRGQDSSVNQKGALALTTVELDKGDGPQVPVEQGQEPPCFLRLFNGIMAVHRGNCPTVSATRPDEQADTEPAPKPSWQPCRLYVMSHDFDGEACALEVEPVANSLRSRGCFVLVASDEEPASNRVLVWFGARAREASRLSARALAHHIANCRPSEFGFAQHSGSAVIVPTECKQSVDDAEFLRLLEQPSSGSTMSVPCPSNDDVTAGATLQRLFHLSLSGSRLVALELLSSSRPDPASTSPVAGDEDVDGDGCAVMTLGDGLPPFPFVQSQLYGMQLHQQQPALLLADAGCCVYLWHGWWPTVAGEPPLEGDGCSAKTESALARFALERRLAAQTALSYAKERRSVDSSAARNCQLVYAGHEPDLFVRLFPSWTTCASATQSNAQDGKRDAENIEDVISCKARCQYSLAELKRRPLPDDVDSLKLETYLSDGEFCELMKMTRDEYANLPIWKQANLKKEVGLF